LPICFHLALQNCIVIPGMSLFFLQLGKDEQIKIKFDLPYKALTKLPMKKVN